ncbi:unnamed protein product [Clonostachys rosea f. rosea IK726]|uniref:Uncharacterized protein n=1 Tax=Clonostachys rosea f. rosea IK726 TaxID=1349383 RepID=A0ACA9TK33_BIOOC|nr:unnamed protein product [Clonostachys rosea f. rosea IK726]
MDRLAKDHMFSPEELAAASPQQILSRMLSTKSYISHDSAEDNICEQRSIEIGKGQCGTIFALSGTDTVAKIPHSAEKADQLWSDFQMHYLVLEAMNEVDTKLKMDINIPELHSWVCPATKPFWTHYGLRFPQDIDAKNFALVSNRVFPVPQPVRGALLDVLCPPAIQKQKQAFLAKPENKNRLIRLYLGRRETTKAKQNIRNIRLQNFPLHVNEMEDLGLDTASFAQVLAQTLAILHWKAGVDGNDVEFILGSSPKSTRLPSRAEVMGGDKYSFGTRFRFDFSRRSISLWLIGFNQCSTFEDNEAGLKKIVDAFFWNDPYYPRPNSTNDRDQTLWAAFSQRYLEVSRTFTDSTTPGAFIAQIEERDRKGTVSGLF